jgi:RNA polymerase sigma-70 factor (ECF subfamily)
VTLNVFARSALYTRVDPVEQALEHLYRSQYARFESVLVTITHDRDTARDAVQDAFAIALARRRQYRGEGSLEAWVWRIALRQAVGLRARSAHPLPADLDSALPAEPSNPALSAAMHSLSPRRRLFLFLRYFADLSYDQIAGACGVRRGTVAATLAQARAELAAELERERQPRGAVR